MAEPAHHFLPRVVGVGSAQDHLEIGGPTSRALPPSRCRRCPAASAHRRTPRHTVGLRPAPRGAARPPLRPERPSRFRIAAFYPPPAIPRTTPPLRRRVHPLRKMGTAPCENRRGSRDCHQSSGGGGSVRRLAMERRRLISRTARRLVRYSWCVRIRLHRDKSASRPARCRKSVPFHQKQYRGRLMRGIAAGG
jgi:hypothetical protein